ncbi:hypothetical protein [Jannaschia sp. W003]|uniref:hypothetical protein n=1 Tax=Jannaschia sp. W003 TaxID=2867012 RepID=UPI0021A2FE6A|nr:hypothetical protein [Jannaschia sp. W003]UWQ20661.1 hypothetical protein K3554_11805 [Jannaschia sp. W003]
MDTTDLIPPVAAKGNCAAPYTWTELGAAAKARRLVGWSGLSRSQLQRLLED